MAGSDRLKRPFRVGVMRGPSQDFKPIATVGLARDGGVFVAPAPVRDFSWVYGNLQPGQVPEIGEHVTTVQRPKLHYHRSGIVRVTLTGADLEPREARYPAIPTMRRGQILSILTVRPWELKTRPGDPPKGDIIAIEPRWPEAIAFSLSVVTLPWEARHTAADLGDLAPIGMLAGDPSRIVVDMVGHDVRALVVVLVTVSHEPEGWLEPGTTVAAIPWTTGKAGDEPREAFGLWSSSVRNPLIRLDTDTEVLSVDDLTRPREGVVRSMTITDKVSDMQERYWRKQ